MTKKNIEGLAVQGAMEVPAIREAKENWPSWTCLSFG